MSNIHSSGGVIICPKCENYACLHHMRCHFCNYILRVSDLEGEK